MLIPEPDACAMYCADEPFSSSAENVSPETCVDQSRSEVVNVMMIASGLVIFLCRQGNNTTSHRWLSAKSVWECQ
jgi:hypothetical protein